MTLYKVDATFDKDNIINVPFSFYVIADDDKEARKKCKDAISQCPKQSGMKNWKLLRGGIKEIADNNVYSYSSLLIE